MIPNNALSATPVVGAFLPPRTAIRFSAVAGRSDVHFGGIAIGDTSQGSNFQIWTAFTDGVNIWLEAPNTAPFIYLANVNAVWVALAFDQNARPFVAWATVTGNASYNWFDSTIPGFRTSTLTGTVPRVFASLDDSRPIMSSLSDILLAYVRAGTLFLRAQRDRFGIEYTLGAAPATLVQIGMSTADRFQFAFQQVQPGSSLAPTDKQGFIGQYVVGDTVLPPVEFSPLLGINEPS